MYSRLWQFPTLYLICIGLIAIAVLSGVSASSRPSSAFTVNKVADTNDGICDTDCSLREAIVAANATAGPDTIMLPAGFYRLSRAGELEDAAAIGDLDITDPLTITGVSSDTTVIDANALDRVIDIKSVSVTLAHVTIQQGVARAVTFPEGRGGGIHIIDGTLILQDTRVMSSTADYGGGIYNDGGHKDLGVIKERMNMMPRSIASSSLSSDGCSIHSNESSRVCLKIADGRCLGSPGCRVDRRQTKVVASRAQSLIINVHEQRNV